MIVPVIIAGGAGTRLWPLSRPHRPKQFHALTGERSLLQETVARLDGIDARPPVVVCDEEHRFIVAEQLRRIGHGEATMLLEPFGRGTAPAITLAALSAAGAQDDPLLLVLPADHVIGDAGRFRAAIEAATPLAEAGRLVAFGIVPDRAETGYGYIRRGEALAGGHGFAIARFEEKPDGATAAQRLASGDHYWNSGMFLFRAGRYLEELKRHRPGMVDACRRAVASPCRDRQFVRIDAEAFAACPSDSIDYAVMENTGAAAMIPLDAGWSDVGSWSALLDALPRDENGNALHGDVLAIASRNNLVRAGDRLVAVLGVDDLVVVETGDAVLVAHRSAAQDVKAIVDLLGRRGAAAGREADKALKSLVGDDGLEPPTSSV